jgi:uncharacterized membrane protein YcaP (DUF421 family)
MTMISELFHMDLSVAEKVVRTVAVYAGILLLLRLGGRRDLAQLSTFDLVVVLLLSNVVQNAIIGPDNSLVGGLLGAVVLLTVNAAWSRLVGLSPTWVRWAQGEPITLVSNGQYLDRVLWREGIRRADLERALRMQGADDVGEVDTAVLNPGGTIVVKLQEAEQNASIRDLDVLRGHIEEGLARIEARLAAAPRAGETRGWCWPRRRSRSGQPRRR